MGVFNRIAGFFRPAPVAPPPSRIQRLRPLGRPAPKDKGRWPEYLSVGITPERLGSIMREADQGRLQQQNTLAQENAGKDGLIQGLLGTRISAASQRRLLCKPNPADRSGRAGQVAAFCAEVLAGLQRVEPGLDGSYRLGGELPSIVEGFAHAAYYGAEAAWIHWGVRRGDPRPRPLYLEFFDERRLAFDVQTESLHLTGEVGGTLGDPLSAFPWGLVVEARNTRVSRRLSQCGAARAIFVPWALRFGAQKDLITYLEVWGLPQIVGKQAADVPASYSEDARGVYEDLVEDLMGDSRSVLPPGFDVEVIQAVAGGEKVFETFDALTERAIQFALVGQTGTSAANNTNKASAEVSERVQDTLVEGDLRMVGGALQRVLAFAVEVEFGPGTLPAVVEAEVETNPDALGEAAIALGRAAYPLAALIGAGIPVNVKKYLAPYGVELTADGQIDPAILRNRALLARLAAGAPSSPSAGGDPANAPPPDPGAVADPTA